MKNCKLTMVLTLALVLILTTTAFAKVTILWRASDYTYVSSEHKDGLSFPYYGVASVKGTDRGVDDYGQLIYYSSTKITYDVQGDISFARARSKNEHDSRQVIKELTAYDKPNNGPKTRAYYSYETEPVTSNYKRNILNKTRVYTGLLEEGSTPVIGEILKIVK
ncbi:MAG: hypothetical protein Q4Q17_00730 [Tissierellia bacterium]|nr:hypothetical protein [Tissierellia bacterium]